MSKDDLLTEEQISTEEIFSGRLVHLFRDEVKLPNGNTSTREYMLHPGAVCIVPIDENGSVVLVKQYRYPLKRVSIEVPAGKLEKDEDILLCAQRELSEETGITAENYIYLGAFLPSVAISDELIHIYLATSLTYGSMHTDEDEFINVLKMPFEEALGMVTDNTVKDGKTQIALMKTHLFLDSKSVKQ